MLTSCYEYNSSDSFRQCLEMEGAVHNLGVTHTDEQINQLAQRHFEKMQVMI